MSRMLRDVCGDFDPKTNTYEVRTIPGPMEAKARFRVDEFGCQARAGWSMYFACHKCLGAIEVAWEAVFDRGALGQEAVVAIAEAAQKEVDRIREDARRQVRRLELLLDPPLSTWELICEAGGRTHGQPGYAPPRWGLGWGLSR